MFNIWTKLSFNPPWGHRIIYFLFGLEFYDKTWGDFGGSPTLEEAYDPKSKEHIINGTFPQENDIKEELTHVVDIFNKYGIDVLDEYRLDGAYHHPFFKLRYSNNIGNNTIWYAHI